MFGCPGPKSPEAPIGSLTLEIGRDGGALRGVAGDLDGTYAAITSFADSPRTTIEARRKAAITWQATLAGTSGPLARAGDQLAVTLGGNGTVAELPLRGTPGAVVITFDALTGAPRWKLAIDASEWAVITSIAPIGTGFVVGGSFAGTLRAATKIVSSAGKIDGFVARLSAKGEVEWLIRTGGANADAITGVAVLVGAGAERIAITGTFATGAELQGEPFVAFDDKSPAVDVFVAELDGKGSRKWSASFGGKLDDSSSGVAIDAKGRVAVAATVRDKLKVDTADISTNGPSDGLVVFYNRDGSPGGSVVLGGEALDGLHGIAAAGPRIVVGGFYAGTIQVGREKITAQGDDAFFAILDGTKVDAVWPVRGAGREEVVAISPLLARGFVAGIGHTAAATIFGQPLASPKDPASGAGLVVRAF
ncbi:MAG: hypothetical protein H0V17_04385 [Deltaproteobacteria bacterium]|nr:hypothetical protein [Deltaproteobacteria bacterium]